MIIGIGSDIANISRFESSFQKKGLRYIETFLTPFEITLFKQRYDRHPHRGFTFLASRFAAKEALGKALGVGIAYPMAFQSVSVNHLSSGQPIFETHHPLKAWLEERGYTLHLTLSDEKEYAIAFVIVETSH